MEPLELRLLGPFEARRGGRPVSVRSRKARALTTVLAVDAPKPRSRDWLADLLWGHTGEERARHNLRQCATTVRKALGDVLVADGDRLGLDPSVDVDVRALARAVDGGVTSELERACARYRGELVESLRVREDPFDHWLAEERRRTRGLVTDALATLAERRLQDGDVEGAIAAELRLLEIEPAREESHQRLMRLYDRTGQRSAALAQYERCLRALSDGFDVEPSEETRRLHDELRTRAAPIAGCATPPARARASEPTDAPALPDRPSIAVLPFDNHGAEDHAYFSDGITEDITIKLSKFGSLFVIARDSAFDHRGGASDVRRVGRELGVHYVAYGSVRRAGPRVRITAQLVDAVTGTHVWAHHYDRDLEDIFDVQDEVTEQIVATLASRVEAEALREARRKPTDNLAAYDAMLRGKDHHHRWTPEDNEIAIAMFRRAIELDPGYALAMAWLACTLGQKYHFAPDPALMPQAVKLFRDAHAIDDAESECYRMFASYHMMRRELDEAEAAQNRGLELNPNDDKSVCQMGELRLWQGRFEEAEVWVRKAIRLNPYHSDAFFYPLGQALFHQERFAEARKALRRVTEPRPRELAYLVAASMRAGAGDDAVRFAERLRARQPGFEVSSFGRSLPYAREADRAFVIDALSSAINPPG